MGGTGVTGRLPRFVAGNPWVLAGIALGVVFSLVVLLAQGHGITFLWDDFSILGRMDRLPRPRAWLEPFNQHCAPLFMLFVDLEHRVFAGDYRLYLVVLWCLHVANIALLGALLRARTGDRAAGLATAAFGVATTYRHVLWWMTTTCIALCFLVSVLAFLAADRYRARGGAVWLSLSLASVFAAPLTFGSGLSLGPIVALEAWVSSAREKRVRNAAPIVAVWAVSCGLQLAFAFSEDNAALPRSTHELGQAAAFFVEMLGLGFVYQVPLIPLAPSFGLGAGLALGYATLLGLLLRRLAQRERTSVLVAHVYLVAVLAPIALVRWKRIDHPMLPAGSSHYQYMPAIVWTTTLAFALERALAAAPRATTAIAGLALAVLAGGHAYVAATDAWWIAPATRRTMRQAELVGLVVSIARETKTPVYDAPLPDTFAWPDTRLRDVVAIVAPGVHGLWTDEKTRESVAPLKSSSLLRSALHLQGDP